MSFPLPRYKLPLHLCTAPTPPHFLNVFVSLKRFLPVKRHFKLSNLHFLHAITPPSVPTQLFATPPRKLSSATQKHPTLCFINAIFRFRADFNKPMRPSHTSGSPRYAAWRSRSAVGASRSPNPYLLSPNSSFLVHSYDLIAARNRLQWQVWTTLL